MVTGATESGVYYLFNLWCDNEAELLACIPSCGKTQVDGGKCSIDCGLVVSRPCQFGPTHPEVLWDRKWSPTLWEEEANTDLLLLILP